MLPSAARLEIVSNAMASLVSLVVVASASGCRPRTDGPVPGPTSCAGQPGCEPCGRWAFGVVQYTAPPLDPSGGTWDMAFDSDPDLRVIVQSPTQSRRTDRRKNTYDATWLLHPPLEVAAGETVALEAYDADITDDDVIETVMIEVPGTLVEGTLVIGEGHGKLQGRCVEAAVGSPGGAAGSDATSLGRATAVWRVGRT